ncbi:U32 family peptidase, partial [Faecalibaculum rodentium]|uniref:U32 family peptidase n=1 Tax=Faecalibaculum rodentium TaxID=1702221 RepID=UPI00259B9B99
HYGDEAVLMAARKTGYDGLMIFQPDTLICSSADVQAVKSMGADVVSLAHELSLEEVLAIAGKTDGLEVQIHGYYPVLSSRRKLLTAYGRTIGSSVIGEGQFSLQETTRPNRIPVLEQQSGTVLFSPEPVQSLRQLPALLDAGIDRLRIDSRFLEPSDRNAALITYLTLINGGLAPDRLSGSDRTWRQQSVKTKEETQ